MSQEQLKTSEKVKDTGAAIAVSDFVVGDTVRIHYRITEGNKTRIQPYEGIVIAKRGEGMSKTFMVRKIGADGVGVERIFPLFSPNIQKLEVIKKGRVRRAKLYYLRGKVGKAAVRVKLRTDKEEYKEIKETMAEQTE